MNDKWTKGEILPTPDWAESYSRKSQKAWSFGLCTFVLFGLVFVGNSSYELVISLFMFIITGINLFKNEAIKQSIQAIIVIMGYIVSISQIIYANIQNYI